MRTHHVVIIASGTAPTHIATPAESGDEAMCDLLWAIDPYHAWQADCDAEAREIGGDK